MKQLKAGQIQELPTTFQSTTFWLPGCYKNYEDWKIRKSNFGCYLTRVLNLVSRSWERTRTEVLYEHSNKCSDHVTCGEFLENLV